MRIVRSGWRSGARAAAAVALLTVAAVTVAPAAAQSDPVEVIRERNRTVETIVKRVGDEPTGAERERLKDVINELIDFRELSRQALGRYWNERTEAERAEFVDTFRELVRNSSVRKLEIYRADSVTYRPAEIDGDRAEVVTVAHRGRKQVEIVYRMHRSGGEWRAFDMLVDGASTARTYRDSFYREIAKSSYEGMYAKLVDRLEEERAGS